MKALRAHTHETNYRVCVHKTQLHLHITRDQSPDKILSTALYGTKNIARYQSKMTAYIKITNEVYLFCGRPPAAALNCSPVPNEYHLTHQWMNTKLFSNFPTETCQSAALEASPSHPLVVEPEKVHA